MELATLIEILRNLDAHSSQCYYVLSDLCYGAKLSLFVADIMKAQSWTFVPTIKRGVAYNVKNDYNH